MLEASPEDPSAWVVTRKQAREQGLKKGDIEKGEQVEQQDDQKEEGEMHCRRRENRRSARDKTENKPGQLVVSIARGVIHWYIEGYLQDPAFEGHWRASLSTADELVMTHRYYKDEDGLLFFWDADWKARLCVPHSLVMETLQEHHESTWETAHAGATRLYHHLAY